MKSGSSRPASRQYHHLTRVSHELEKRKKQHGPNLTFLSDAQSAVIEEENKEIGSLLPRPMAWHDLFGDRVACPVEVCHERSEVRKGCFGKPDIWLFFVRLRADL
jgi:hypothetical protein